MLSSRMVGSVKGALKILRHSHGLLRCGNASVVGIRPLTVKGLAEVLALPANITYRNYD